MRVRISPGLPTIKLYQQPLDLSYTVAMWHRVTFKFNIYFSIDDQHEQTDEAIAWLKESGLGFKCRRMYGRGIQYNGFGLRLWRQGRTFFYFENEADALYFVLRFNGAFKDTEVTLG